MAVASHVGAWIETPLEVALTAFSKVASHVGAWIETFSGSATPGAMSSRPTWARGLKRLKMRKNVKNTGRVPRGRVD